MSNTFGNILGLTTFGESHGISIGGIVDGCPSGIPLDLEAIQHELDRRKPGQSLLTTQRKESDTVVIQSGIFEGKTTGTPIGFIIANEDHRSQDYSHIAEVFRPSHADSTYWEKYGIRDYRGGGRSSARETACRVVGGAIARQMIPFISVKAYVSSVGNITLKTPYPELDLSRIDDSPVRCPDAETAKKMEQYILDVKSTGDTVGGVITCVVQNVPAGLGEPIFGKLHAALGNAMLSINAVKGFEYGSGFAGTTMHGSQHNDLFNTDFSTKTNHSGGIQGGISNGMDIYFRVAFKPVATILQKQMTVNIHGEEMEMMGKGRHDACVLPRAVPIVEAMTYLVLADYWLLSRIQKLSLGEE